MVDIFFEKPVEGFPWDVAIVGSGPSALTAAIYTTRGAASTYIIGGSSWGGQLMLTTLVDNFPGFPDGIQGPELMDRMRKQAVRFGAEFVSQDLTSLNLENSPFELEAQQLKLKAKSIIIATGAGARWLDVPGEDKLLGRGISSCAPCDAPFFKEKKVVVIGGGDSAMEEALVLTKYAREVIIIHRRDSFRASAAMQSKVFANEKIKILWNTQVKEFIGNQKLQGVKLIREGKEEELAIDGAFVAIGHAPATEIFKGKIELDEKGYVKRYEKNGFKMATSVPGVFVAGDVHDYHYRQAITAAGFGCMAGMEALKYLQKDIPSY